MGHLTFADLIARRVPLAASEAAALTLAVARLLDVQRASGQRVRLPDDSWILLSSNGDVSIVEVHGSLEGDETAALSALLGRLLRLDERLPAGRHGVVPGGLLIVLARNLGHIHLPTTGPSAFRTALERFASHDPALLSSVFWRAASGRPDGRTARNAAARRAESRLRGERRHRGPSAADLRRALREMEQELFELRGGLSRSPDAGHRPAIPRWRAVVAPALAVCVTGVLAVAALAVTSGPTDSLALTSASDDVSLSPQPVEALVTRPAPPPRPADASVREGSAADDPPRGRDRTVRRVSTPVRAVGTPAETPVSRPRPKRPDPLAALRGGTRGIPFALPPG